METARDYRQTRFTEHSSRDLVWKEICRFLQTRYIPTTSKILDVGAGYGSFINNIVGQEKHAVDISPDLPGCVDANVFAHVSSCTSLAMFTDDSMDLTFASNLLEHLTAEDCALTLAEMKRVLKPGGRLILIQPNFRYCYKEYFDDYTHVRIFTHVALCDLLSAYGFLISKVVPRFLPFSMKSSLPKSPFLVRCYLRSPIKPFAGQMLIVAERPAKG